MASMEWNGAFSIYVWDWSLLRTGDREMYLQGEAMSRIRLACESNSWPKRSHYTGETNPALRTTWKFY